MMMRRLLVCALLLSGCRTAPFHAVDQSIEMRVAQGVPSIAYAIAHKGRIVHEGAAGFASAGARATPHTPYPLASVTKPFIATAVMRLVAAGRIDLDAPAARYAAGWIPTSDTYTIRQLLNHTSGLPTYATIRWSGATSPPDDLKAMVRRYAFSAHPPGTVSEYSNLGYGLLGHILEVQSGQPLAALLESEVLRPLGLRETRLVESGETPPGFAQKHSVEGHLLPSTLNDTAAAGNLYASVHDLVRFGAFHLDRNATLLSYEAREMMRSYVEPGALFPYYNKSPYGLSRML
jgi:CubicO group peptidase (beta-lactamase class C family)